MEAVAKNTLGVEDRLHRRGEDGYEMARQAAVWNGRKPDRFPDLILVAESAQDVVDGVKLAKANGQRVGIRSGGHSVVATGVRNGGLPIDVFKLTEITVDVAGMTAWIGPGVRGMQLGQRLRQDCLSFPYGGSPSVGLGASLVTGGYGLNGKSLGSGASNIKAVDVATADGELIRADEATNTDYLWAARGGGYGFFGVVVRFQIQLHKAPGLLTKAAFVFSFDDFNALMAWFFKSYRSFDKRLMTIVFGLRVPTFDQPVIRILSLGFADTLEETAEIYRPLTQAPIMERALIKEEPTPTTLEQVWTGVDLLYPEGARYFAETCWIEEPDNNAFISALKLAFEGMPTRGSHIMLNPWVPEDELEGALSGATTLPVHLYGVGEAPAQDEQLQHWITSKILNVVPFSNGVGKVNESDLLIRDQHVLAPANIARLEARRARHDPRRRFHSFLRPES